MSKPAFPGFVLERVQYTSMSFTFFPMGFSKALGPQSAATQATRQNEEAYLSLRPALTFPLCRCQTLVPMALWLLYCSQDKCLPILERHFADPSTTQAPPAVKASAVTASDSFLYTQWVLPMASVYPYTPHTPVVQVEMLAPNCQGLRAQVTDPLTSQPFQNALLNPGLGNHCESTILFQFLFNVLV